MGTEDLFHEAAEIDAAIKRQAYPEHHFETPKVRAITPLLDLGAGALKFYHIGPEPEPPTEPQSQELAA